MKFCIYCNKRIVKKKFNSGPYYHIGCRVNAFEVISKEISVELWRKMYRKWGV